MMKMLETKVRPLAGRLMEIKEFVALIKTKE
jgi:hypothetical protein